MCFAFVARSSVKVSVCPADEFLASGEGKRFKQALPDPRTARSSIPALQAVHEERPGPHVGIRVHGVAVVLSCFLLNDGIAKKQTPPKRGWVNSH